MCHSWYSVCSETSACAASRLVALAPPCAHAVSFRRTQVDPSTACDCYISSQESAERWSVCYYRIWQYTHFCRTCPPKRSSTSAKTAGLLSGTSSRGTPTRNVWLRGTPKTRCASVGRSKNKLPSLLFLSQLCSLQTFLWTLSACNSFLRHQFTFVYL